MIARNNWERRQKWSYTEIIIITLKDLQWQSDERQQGLCVIVGQIVPSIDCAEEQTQIQSKQYYVVVGVCVGVRMCVKQ